MSKNKNILILNTGGTFSKIYNDIDGNLAVPNHNKAVETILKNSKISNCTVNGLIYKDSLNINQTDRVLLKNQIKKSNYEKIIIIHGTDTMDKTAKYLAKHITNKTIILTGSMVPFSLDKVEATSNFMLAFGYILSNNKNNIYIAMHGNVKKYNKIVKNRILGVFECLK